MDAVTLHVRTLRLLRSKAAVRQRWLQTKLVDAEWDSERSVGAYSDEWQQHIELLQVYVASATEGVAGIEQLEREIKEFVVWVSERTVPERDRDTLRFLDIVEVAMVDVYSVLEELDRQIQEREDFLRTLAIVE